LPLVNALQNDAASLSNFMMLSVPYDDKPENVIAYMKTMGFAFPVYTDTGGSAATGFGVTGVPETYIIDKKGVLRRKVIGAADWSSTGERQLINTLLKE
jgi:AhpC/TSA family